MDKQLALKLLAYRRENQRYRYYTPNGAVEQFINLVGSNSTFINLFSAANGVGKSAAGANILANMMFPTDNKWFKDLSLFAKFPYLQQGRIISDPTTLTKTIIPELKRWFPKGMYSTSKEGHDYESFWKTNTGFSFDLMSNEQDAKEFESANLGWAWFDEPPREEIYKATVARMRRGGIIIITATPLAGSAWLYDDIYTNREAGQRAVVEADVEENCVEHGIRGILKHEDILRMISEYDEEDKQARIFGRFQHLTGLVYKKFNRQTHVIKPFSVNQDRYTVYEFLDNHPRNEDMITWVAVNPEGDHFIVDELYINVESADELAARIKKVAEQYNVEERFADPSAWNEDQHKIIGQKDLATQLAEHGLNYQRASKERAMGIRLTRDALDWQAISLGDGNTLIKKPKLFVFEHCDRTIWEFEHWQYNEWSGKTKEKRNPSEKPQDKDDHAMENIGRAFLANLKYVPPVYSSRTYVEGEEPVLDPYR